MEVRRLDAFSAGKVTGVLCAVAGGIGGALGVVLVFLLKPSALSEDPILVILSALFGLCAYPALSFMIGAAAGMLFAAVFNTTAHRLGGLRIELSGSEDTEEPPTSTSSLPEDGGTEQSA